MKIDVEAGVNAFAFLIQLFQQNPFGAVCFLVLAVIVATATRRR